MKKDQMYPWHVREEATPHHNATARQRQCTPIQIPTHTTAARFWRENSHKAGSLDRPRMQSRVKGSPSLLTLLFTNVSIQCAEVEINSAPRFDRDQAGREVSHACPRLFVSLRAERARRGSAGAMVSDVTMTYFRRIMKYRRCVRVCRSTCMWRGKNSARRLSKPTHAPRGKRQADPTTDGTEVLLSPGSEENGREREVARSIIPVVR